MCIYVGSRHARPCGSEDNSGEYPPPCVRGGCGSLSLSAAAKLHTESPTAETGMPQRKVTCESHSPGKVGRLRPSQVTANLAVLARDSHCEVEGWGPDLWKHGPSLRLLLEEA